jgi:hypothetical protein
VVYGLIWELSPDAFVNLVAPEGDPKEVAAMLYFSLTTLTTTGYGDIVAVDPFARSVANLESVLGQFFLAITVARLVTMELGIFAPKKRFETEGLAVPPGFVRLKTEFRG